MIIFDGIAAAVGKEEQLRQKLLGNPPKKSIKICAILFREDAGSVLYARLKQEAAKRLGIVYEILDFSFTDESARVVATIDRCNRDWQVTGVIVQKPSKRVWQQATGRTELEYQMWWQMIMGSVNPAKDVDGLHPETIRSIANGDWKSKSQLLPATCKAVLLVIDEIGRQFPQAMQSTFCIVGKSDLVGRPLAAVLQQSGRQAELLGVKELEERNSSGQYLKDASIIVSATGREKLISGEMISQGVALIDVGEPKPDIDRESVSSKAAFLSPSPGGVGPLTVVMLMENAILLSEKTT